MKSSLSLSRRGLLTLVPYRKTSLVSTSPFVSVIRMFNIKICGIQRPADIAAVESSGADAVGLNFFPPSVRYVDPSAIETQALSSAASQAGLFRVGVFVNESPREIAEISRHIGLDAVQLHGDEAVADAERIRSACGLPLIRAIKLPTAAISPTEIAAHTDPWVAADCHLLLDADAGAAHGGSGKTLDWPSIRAWAEQAGDGSWTLAGGLGPENVAEAIRVSGAVSVDTASGVEEPRGVKSAERIERFVANIRAEIC